MDSIPVFNICELRTYYPKGFKTAYEKYRDGLHPCSPDIDAMLSEMVDSLKEIVHFAGGRLDDYSIGPYNRGNKIRVSFDGYVEDLRGPRALSWYDGALIDPMRIPWGIESRIHRKKAKYKYFPWEFPPCPFTGVFFDDVILEALKTAFIRGESVKYAFQSDVLHTMVKLVEDEQEYYTSEDHCVERMYEEGLFFTKYGQQVEDYYF